MFQFTRPRGARRRQGLPPLPSVCFNSRAHGGRDRVRATIHRDIAVSIHAPTGGATAVAMRVTYYGEVSIHAPTGGATRLYPAAEVAIVFQFTRPRGARHLVLARTKSAATVSIHAPTGGATHTYQLDDSGTWFQFTRPRGARPTPSGARTTTPRFNSRAHGGRDSRGSSTCARGSVSIHAPTGGATDKAEPSATAMRFQFTRPRGARLSLLAGCVYRGAFQFTRPRGARHAGLADALEDAVSIHAPTGGATRRGRSRDACANVSIHAPTGGATDKAEPSATAMRFQFTRPRGARLRRSRMPG